MLTLNGCEGSAEGDSTTEMSGADARMTSGDEAGDAMEGASIAGADMSETDPFADVMCDVEGFEPLIEKASAFGGSFRYDGSTSESPYDRIELLSLTDWGGPTAPGTYELDGISYADCGLCLLAHKGCNSGECEQTFYAQEGTVEISELNFEGSGQLTARLNHIVFREVTINPSTSSATEVPEGQTWCLEEFDLNETLSDLPSGSGDCGASSASCIGDAIADYELLSCATGETVSAHTLMDQNEKGLWMVLGAGWCGACSSFIPEVRAREASLDAQGVHTIYVLGEDRNGARPSLDYCSSYAARYGEGALARFYIDNSDGGSFRSTFSQLWPYTGPNGSFGLPWNAMVRSGAYRYEYVYADGAGGSYEAGLNELINP